MAMTCTLNLALQVSKSQIAKLVADVFSDTSIAENKVCNLPCLFSLKTFMKIQH